MLVRVECRRVVSRVSSSRGCRGCRVSSVSSVSSGCRVLSRRFASKVSRCPRWQECSCSPSTGGRVGMGCRGVESVSRFGVEVSRPQGSAAAAAAYPGWQPAITGHQRGTRSSLTEAAWHAESRAGRGGCAEDVGGRRSPPTRPHTTIMDGRWAPASQWRGERRGGSSGDTEKIKDS